HPCSFRAARVQHERPGRMDWSTAVAPSAYGRTMNRLPRPDEMPEPLAGLLRDHERTAGVVADARATFDSVTLHGPEQASARVVEVARDLQHFLAADLTLHIAKEEEVLFPALRSLAEG